MCDEKDIKEELQNMPSDEVTDIEDIPTQIPVPDFGEDDEDGNS